MIGRRYRPVRVYLHGGRPVAVICDRTTGTNVRVWSRLGRWRFFANDNPVQDRALAGAARRAIRLTERDELVRQERRVRDELRAQRTLFPIPVSSPRAGGHQPRA